MTAPSVSADVDSLKLTSYFGERQRAEGRFAADALLDLYGRRGIATSILMRGTEGFGAKHRLRTDLSLTLSEDLPLIAIAVDSRPRIEPLFDEARKLTGIAADHGRPRRLDRASESDALRRRDGVDQRAPHTPAGSGDHQPHVGIFGSHEDFLRAPGV